MHISKKYYILKMNAHFEKELHFENESVFFGKVKVINHFFKKLQLAHMGASWVLPSVTSSIVS